MRPGAIVAITCVLAVSATPSAHAQPKVDEDVTIYSTEPGGGSLAAPGDAFSRDWRVTESLCAGGLCLYTGVSPGFRTPNEAAPGLFPLAQGTELSLEIIAIEPVLSIRRDGQTVDAPGESLVLGTASGLHVHPEFQVTVEEGQQGDFPLRFRLKASGPVAYEASPEYELVFTNASPTPSPTPQPSPTVSPRPTVAPIVELQLERPRGRGDQVVAYFDARDGFTSFLNLANEGRADLDVRIVLQDAAFSVAFETIESIPAGGTRTIDVGSLRSSGLLASAGLAFATALGEGGGAVTSGVLAGNFTVANLATSSAWGGPAAARRAWRRQGEGFVQPAPGTVIDGVSVVLEQLAPDALDLSVYYDPATLQPAAEGGNQVIFASFADVAGLPLATASQPQTWMARTTRNDGALVSSELHVTSGVEVSHLVGLAGDGVEGAAGRIGFTASAPAASNRLIFFQESLGTFATGYLLPEVPVAGGSEIAVSSRTIAEPAGRGDQLVFYYDARDGFTTFLNLANEGRVPLEVRVVLHDASLRFALERMESIPAEGTRTIDVGALRAEGLPVGPGLAFATAVDASGAGVASGALAGSFTVANLATASAWGGPAAARRALTLEGGEYRPAPEGAVIDGDLVVLEQIQPPAVDLSVYYDPDSLEPASEGGNQILFLSFSDATGEASGAVASRQAWRTSAFRNSGEPLATATLESAGVEVSHLEDVIGPQARGSAGRVAFEAVEPLAENRLIFFVESLGTFATGYRLPAVPASE